MFDSVTGLQRFNVMAVQCSPVHVNTFQDRLVQIEGIKKILTEYVNPSAKNLRVGARGLNLEVHIPDQSPAVGAGDSGSPAGSTLITAEVMHGKLQKLELTIRLYMHQFSVSKDCEELNFFYSICLLPFAVTWM